MSTRLTVRLPDDLSRALDAAASRTGRKRSEITRLALRRVLKVLSTERPAERVQDLLGSLESGIPDLAERHREYLLESLQNGG